MIITTTERGRTGMRRGRQAWMEKAGSAGRGGEKVRNDVSIADMADKNEVHYDWCRQSEWVGDGRCSWVTFQGGKH